MLAPAAHSHRAQLCPGSPARLKHRWQRGRSQRSSASLFAFICSPHNTELSHYIIYSSLLSTPTLGTRGWRELKGSEITIGSFVSRIAKSIAPPDPDVSRAASACQPSTIYHPPFNQTSFFFFLPSTRGSILEDTILGLTTRCHP